MNILAVNPGSTTTKVGVYMGNELFQKSFSHDREFINQFPLINDQKNFRFECIISFLREKAWENIQFDAVVGRGGFIKPVEGGVYEVNALMLDDLEKGVGGMHACNLGGVLANMFALLYNRKAYIVDPVVIDEMDDVAKVSGFEGIERKSFFHALNQKAVARDLAQSLGKKYEDLNFIVAHLGGGISIGAHKKGRVVDVNNALSGDGPFAPERAGGLPIDGLMDFISKNSLDPDDVIRNVSRAGGVYSYTGIVDIEELEKRHKKGDKKATQVLDAMIYQIAKEIGSLASVLSGDVDAIVLTGGIAFSEFITERIKERVSFIADFVLRPGGFEMEALVDGVKRVLNGQEKAKEYV